MMYNTWEEIAENVPNFSIMTNSVANNGNPFGSADYAKNRNKILNTGIDIWEYEGGYSYHGKSILIDDDISVIGSFNMDMRSTYLDTELMLVIRSKEINKQLEEGMMEYEKVSRQALEDGTYHDPYHVKPIELTKKRQRNVFLVQHLLGWARYLF
jgi:putative cardiolipin synthase